MGAEIIGFFSLKGGVGKTTMTANIGSVLKHEFGFRVLLVDTHILGADLSTHFGLLKPPVSIKDFLDGKLPPSKIIYKDPRTGIDIIPGPLNPNPRIKVSLKKLKNAIEPFRRKYDFILLDTPPWLGRETEGIVKTIDKAVVIGTPSTTGVLEALRTIRIIERKKKKVGGVLINFYKGREYELKKDEIEKLLEDYEIIGFVPEDEKIRRALGYGIPVVIASPNSKGTRAIVEAAAFLGGIEYEEPPRGIFARLLNALGLK